MLLSINVFDLDFCSEEKQKLYNWFKDKSKVADTSCKKFFRLENQFKLRDSVRFNKISQMYTHTHEDDCDGNHLLCCMVVLKYKISYIHRVHRDRKEKKKDWKRNNLQKETQFSMIMGS